MLVTKAQAYSQRPVPTARSQCCVGPLKQDKNVDKRQWDEVQRSSDTKVVCGLPCTQYLQEMERLKGSVHAMSHDSTTTPGMFMTELAVCEQEVTNLRGYLQQHVLEISQW